MKERKKYLKETTLFVFDTRPDGSPKGRWIRRYFSKEDAIASLDKKEIEALGRFYGKKEFWLLDTYGDVKRYFLN